MERNKPYEIGSHFHLDYNEIGDFAYTFSGRSAIELVLKDILNNKKISSVYMPSYCCSSMVQPFVDKEIDIIYYKVIYKAGRGLVYEIDTSTNCDIFFAMSYFGLDDHRQDTIIESFSKRGIIIIEDITHSLFRNVISYDNIEYSFASVRKWIPIASGGFVKKTTGSFIEKPTLSSDDIVNLKFEAMNEKHSYLEGIDVSKESFMEKISSFEKNFTKLDSSYKIDSKSLKIINGLDLVRMKEQRINNGKTLYKGLERFDLVELLIPNPDFSKACPLFVPIMVKEGLRDDLRKFLISNNVYCPVHWPDHVGESGQIQESELSLICDQRYDENDMEYIIELIGDWHTSKERL